MLRNKLIYISILLCMVFVLIMYPSIYIAVAIRITLILPVLSWLQMKYTVHRSTVSFRVSKKQIFRGKETEIPLEIRIVNEGRFPLLYGEVSLRYQNLYQGYEMQDWVSFGAVDRDMTTVTYYLYTLNSGIVEIALDQVRFYDFLKIWKCRQRSELKEQAAVMPDMDHSAELEFSLSERMNPEADVYSKQRPGDDSTEVFDIREYRPGDKLRSIHWKLSSKQEALIVKEASYPISEAPLFFVELWQPSGGLKAASPVAWQKQVDCFLDHTAAVLRRAVQEETTLELGCYLGDNTRILHSPIATFADIYTGIERLMHAPFYDTFYGIADYAASSVETGYRYVIYVCARWSEAQLNLLSAQQQKTPVFFVWIPAKGRITEAERKEFFSQLIRYGLDGTAVTESAEGYKGEEL